MSCILLGTTKDEMGGSHYHLVHGARGRRACRGWTWSWRRASSEKLHEAIARGLVRACHDLSEGGLAVGGGGDGVRRRRRRRRDRAGEDGRLCRT